MKKLKQFFLTSLLGGLIVVLPVAILAFIIQWLVEFIVGLIKPLTNFINDYHSLPHYFHELIALIIIALVCFLLGVFVRTRMGNWIYNIIESKLLIRFPGYNLVKETVHQFLGKKKSPFSSVALCNIFGNETLVTAFITDEHPEDKMYSVFVPTGPNPTSGNIYHLKEEYVHVIDAPVEDTMRSIISCGAGSSMLIKSYMDRQIDKNNDSKKE